VVDRRATLGGALAAGLALSVAFELTVFGWFARAIATYSGAPWGLALALVLLAAPLLQPELVVFPVVRRLVRRHTGRAAPAALAGACAWIGTEWLVPKLFADTLGYGLHPSRWMRQGADAIGVHGLTFVLVIANECVLGVARAVRAAAPGRERVRRALAPAACGAALVATLAGYGALRCRQLERDAAAGASLRAGVVQADISRYERLAADLGTFEAVRRILDAHIALSRQALARADLDLLVWPETVYPTTFGAPKSPDGAAFDREIAGFVAATGRPLVFGSYDVEGRDEYNAAFFLEPAPRGPLVFETYRKATLFPLTESVPGLLESERVRRLLPWLGTWKPGPGPRVVPLTVRGGRTLQVVPLICYDVLAPGLVHAAVRQGADLIVTLSNDSWFDAGNGPRLHLVGAAFRSIETRRPQLRATNTGISAVIDASGELLATAAVHERTTLVAAVTPDRRATTLVLAWGEWFAPAALAVGALLLAVALAAGRSTAAPAVAPRARRRCDTP
jgi:apolipoprotein N-acyltransferase